MVAPFIQSAGTSVDIDKCSSDHPSIKYIYAVLLLTPSSYFLTKVHNISPHINYETQL